MTDSTFAVILLIGAPVLSAAVFCAMLAVERIAETHAIERRRDHERH